LKNIYRWIAYLCYSLILALSAVHVQGGQVASIVFGSYSSRAGAETARNELEMQLAEPLQIAAVDVSGRTYFRILSVPNEDVEMVRNYLSRIRSRVGADAWVLEQSSEDIQLASEETLQSSTGSESSSSNLLDSNKPQPPMAPSISSGRSTAAATPHAKKKPLSSTTQRETKDYTFASLKSASSPELHRGAGNSVNPEENLILTRIKSGSSNDRLDFSRTPDGGVDATKVPLVLPKFANPNVKVDGRLDEAVWQQVPRYNSMTVIEPDTLAPAGHNTVSLLFYTDEGLYFGARAEQPQETLIPRLTSRDQDINRDGTYINLDPTGEGRYGFFFGVNLGGSVTDGTILPEIQISQEWDGPWDGAAMQTEYGYSTETFLPWSMMPMPDVTGIRKMGIFISRKVAYLDERWGWPALPFTKTGVFLSALQPFQVEQVNPRQQLAFYPFTASTVDKIRDDTLYRTGMDIFWRPSSNLQLTATLNPDFGTVESDKVVINLTAIETYFPEKRLFFLEGSDIFVTSPRSSVRMSSSYSSGARRTASTFTTEPTTLVNTRRIGGPAPDPEIPLGVTIAGSELGKPTELLGAAKITGQWGGFRYGVLGASEEDTKFHGTMDDDGSPVRVTQQGRDFSVLRFLYESAENGRRSLGWISTRVAHPEKDAMTHGIDAHYFSKKGNFYWDGQLLYSDVDKVEGYGGFVDVTYIPKRGLFHRLTFDFLDDKLDVTDFGFVRRNDLILLRYSFSSSTSNLQKLRGRTKSLTLDQEYNTDGLVVRSGIFWRNGWTFNNRSQINTQLVYFPARWDDINSAGNGAYRLGERRVAEISYGSDTARKLSASIAASLIEEEIGDWAYIGKGGITYKPNDRFSLDLDLSYRRTERWLLHVDGPFFATYNAIDLQPRVAIDLFFSARQQLRLTLQWAGIKAKATELLKVPERDGGLISINDDLTEPTYDFTISRITSQIRYRWEIAPLSDLFIVYTRGSNLPNQQNDEFSDLFHDALVNPVIDMFVVKLRYRFGK